MSEVQRYLVIESESGLTEDESSALVHAAEVARSTLCVKHTELAGEMD